MPTYSLITFGCQMNEHDSARMREVLEAAHYLPASAPTTADLVVLNTCSVREKAEHKLRSEVGRLGRLKRRRPGLLIVVAGCVAQQEGERILGTLPQIDLVLGPDNIRELPELLAALEAGGPPRVRTEFDLDSPQFLRARPVPGQTAPTAYVTVMKGCDERCSFCIVPRTRGPERYRPSQEIMAEIAGLVGAGVREVTVLGQTVNSYRDPERLLQPAVSRRPWRHTPEARLREDESEFSALLREIATTNPGLVRLRYMSPHPRHLTWSLIEAHHELKPLARHLHLPVQSGSDRVLRRMVRRHTVAEYEERVGALRGAVPGLTLSTDIIVGFPGETEEDFAETLELVNRIRPTGLFGFKYSPRPHTPALRLGDEIPETEKRARLSRLFALSEQLRQAHLASLVGSTVGVLVEGPGEREGYVGRTERNEIVHFGAVDDPTGQVLQVRVTEAFKNSLAGVLLDPARAAPIARARTTEPRARHDLPVIP
ncbi:MAG: tRNA (N6-isopentenyl adenosine(37)-C2)-methylthiotransferase MiaB [Polyangiaceae bacterium]|nr:tRNA (N6-isopentenyl adenosine(37)-C2)-methylthiotransferase MiaB [Polyangiaceae bacterium]